MQNFAKILTGGIVAVTVMLTSGVNATMSTKKDTKSAPPSKGLPDTKESTPKKKTVEAGASIEAQENKLAPAKEAPKKSAK